MANREAANLNTVSDDRDLPDKQNPGQPVQAGFDPEAFRQEIRRFCKEQIPEDIARKISRHAYFSREDRIRWQRLLNDQGWFIGDWPVEYGGQGWGPLQRFILIEELERAGTPWLTHFGVSFIGPVIFTFGNDEQKQQYLKPIQNSETWWCQGFSEPGAGSDLASLKTRAVRDGEHYIVTGQKTWTTMAQWADMMFCLVRTHQTERRQQGISFLLIDMNSPGVTIRPIETIDGCHHINEVFLDEVKVPVENLVGREGDGWDMARFIVGRERLLVTEVGKARHLLEELKKLSTQVLDGGRPVASSRSLQLKLAELEVDLQTLRATAYAAVAEFEAGNDSGVYASLLKIRGSELQQAVLDTTLEVMARAGLAFQPEALGGDYEGHLHGPAGAPGMLYEHFYSRATSIYGGSNEIQRGIIAKGTLGL